MESSVSAGDPPYSSFLRFCQRLDAGIPPGLPALNGNCDVRTGYYGELEVAATFHKSIYALLEPKEIKKFLDGENFGYKS